MCGSEEQESGPGNENSICKGLWLEGTKPVSGQKESQKDWAEELMGERG